MAKGLMCIFKREGLDLRFDRPSELTFKDFSGKTYFY